MEQSIRLERRFAIIDEWLLDLDISDRAVRLYAVLARYADSETHKAYPSRKTLAERCKCSTASIDRAAQELVDSGAMVKEHRFNSSVVYTLQVSSPLSRGVLTGDEGGSSGVTRGVLTGDDVTITTELEPEELYIEKDFKPQRATQLPSNFAPKDADNFAEKYPELYLQETLEAFLDHHTAKGSTFKDWDAAWRTWCRNAKKWARPAGAVNGGGSVVPSRSPYVGGPREWVQDLHDMGEHFECKTGEFGCK
jgi:hypothetical protein